MRNFFLPTHENGYRAKLISVPVLALIALGLLVFNSGLIKIPEVSSEAEVTIDKLVEAHNSERAKVGLQALSHNKVLDNSALQKGTVMMETNCWSHYCPQGKQPWDYFDAVGYKYVYAGENLAEGFFTVEDAMVAWMNSPTHKANVLKPEYTEIGFSILQGEFQGRSGNLLIVAHFGTPPSGPESQTPPIQNAGLPTPVITEPTDKVYLNAEEIMVVGSAPRSQIVTLYNRGERLATLAVRDGFFSYSSTKLPEGEYQLYAVGSAGTDTSPRSKLVTFTIDRTAEPVPADNIQAVRLDRDGYVTLSFSAGSMSSAVLELGGRSYVFFQTASGTWETIIKLPDLRSEQSFSLSTVDAAGNQWQGEFPSATLAARAEMLTIPEVAGGSNFILDAGIKAQVDLAVLLILSLLFAADFIVLSFTGLTRPKGKSHLHFALFVVVGIILATGVFGGQIGIGLHL